MAVEKLILNGVNGANGEYLFPPIPLDIVSAVAQGQQLEEKDLQELRWWNAHNNEASYAPVDDIDPKNLSQAGWGILFPADLAPEQQGEILETLQPLLALRREQAGQRYKEYIGPDGYRPLESKQHFLSRHCAGPGLVDPTKVPYYLLLIGSPEAIPYRFQYQLDVQYAVGRLYFETLEEYSNYARAVVAAETERAILPSALTLVGVRNNDDSATASSAYHLIAPLRTALAQANPQWHVCARYGTEAMKASISPLFGGAETPAILFTASHGMGFPSGDSRQSCHQGALLCQDWPGPKQWKEPIPEEHYFSGDDIVSDARLSGLISFHFACYGAGTPQMDDFAHQAFRQPVAIAPHAFLARLPQRMLGHPQGGALAVIGHVERAWGYSFMWPGAGEQLQTFESAFSRLMKGYPVGFAMEPFNARYAELSSDLSAELEEIERNGKIADDFHLAGMWTANNDARSYVVLGDPAVRVCAAEKTGCETHDPRRKLSQTA